MNEASTKALELRLEELLAENNALKTALDRETKRMTVWSDSLMEKYPLLLGVVGKRPPWNSKHVYAMENSFTNSVSKLVRSVVFSDTAHELYKMFFFQFLYLIIIKISIISNFEVL